MIEWPEHGDELKAQRKATWKAFRAYLKEECNYSAKTLKLLEPYFIEGRQLSREQWDVVNHGYLLLFKLFAFPSSDQEVLNALVHQPDPASRYATRWHLEHRVALEHFLGRLGRAFVVDYGEMGSKVRVIANALLPRHYDPEFHKRVGNLYLISPVNFVSGFLDATSRIASPLGDSGTNIAESFCIDYFESCIPLLPADFDWESHQHLKRTEHWKSSHEQWIDDILNFNPASFTENRRPVVTWFVEEMARRLSEDRLGPYLKDLWDKAVASRGER